MSIELVLSDHQGREHVVQLSGEEVGKLAAQQRHLSPRDLTEDGQVFARPSVEQIEARVRAEPGLSFAQAARLEHEAADERRLTLEAALSDAGGPQLSDEAVREHQQATGLSYADAASDLAGRGGRR